MALLLIPFGLLAAGMFLLSYNHTASVHQGASTKPASAGGVLGALRWAFYTQFGLGTLVGKGLDAAIRIGRGWVSHWALAHVKAVARWFIGLNLLAQRVAREMTDLATDTADSFQKMRHKVIPHAVQVGVAPVRAQARTANRHAETALTRERALRAHVSTQRAMQVRFNARVAHGIDVAIPQRLGRIETKNRTQDATLEGLRDTVRGVEQGAIDTFKWLSAHRTTAAMGVFTGAVAWALSRLGYGFLRCRSWQNLGRSIKCSDANVLRDLLLGATALAIGMDLVTLAREEQRVVKDISTVVHDLWHV